MGQGGRVLKHFGVEEAVQRGRNLWVEFAKRGVGIKEQRRPPMLTASCGTKDQRLCIGAEGWGRSQSGAELILLTGQKRRVGPAGKQGHILLRTNFFDQGLCRVNRPKSQQSVNPRNQRGGTRLICIWGQRFGQEKRIKQRLQSGMPRN